MDRASDFLTNRRQTAMIRARGAGAFLQFSGRYPFMGWAIPSYIRKRHWLLAWPTLFVVLAAGVFGFVFSTSGKILSYPGQDGPSQLVPWFAFEARSFRNWHIPLWSPQCFCGMPFVANLNSACFYPLNWLCAVLPEATFLNVDLILNVVLAGWFTSLWCRGRGIGWGGSILAGVVMMFSGVVVMHMGAGHLDILMYVPWPPLIFLAIDKIFDEPNPLRWALLGIFAVGMSVLSGYAQLIYYVGLLAGLYTALRMGQELWDHYRGKGTEPGSVAPSARPPLRRLAMVGGFALLAYAGGAALGAIQLLPAMAAASESVREHGLTYEFASGCPESPADFFTLFAPGFWGDVVGSDIPADHAPLDARASWYWKLNGAAGQTDSAKPVDYFARWYSWETSTFVGMIALALAAYGAVFGARQARRFMLLLIVICIVLALGKFLPLYRILFNYFPMYGSFRTTSRFNIPFTLFVAVLAGAGFDRLRQRTSIPWGFLGVLSLAAAVLLGASAWLRHDAQRSDGFWTHKLLALSYDPDVLTIDGSLLRDPAFVRRAGEHAANTLIPPADLLIAAGAILLLMRVSPRYAYLLVLLVVCESMQFAWFHRPEADMETPFPDAWNQSISELDDDGRVLSTSLGFANLGMSRGYNDAYGYDATTPLRYAEFLAEIQTDIAPWLDKKVKEGLNFVPPVVVGLVPDADHPGHARLVYSRRLWLTRARAIFALVHTPRGMAPADIPLPPQLHRLELVSRYQVRTTRDDIFAAINELFFDPTQTAILEQEPDPKPQAESYEASFHSADPSKVSVLEENADRMIITADLPAPRILLITDSYTKGWKARSLDSNPPQSSYSVIPADYTFRAIPLAAGHHKILLEYAPPAFTAGWVVSLLTLAGMIGGTRWVLWRQRTGE
jgi:hypothetical protein